MNDAAILLLEKVIQFKTTFDVSLLFIVNFFVRDFTSFGRFGTPEAVLMMTLYLYDLRAAFTKYFVYIATAFMLSKHLLKLDSVRLLDLRIYYYYFEENLLLLIIGHN